MGSTVGRLWSRRAPWQRATVLVAGSLVWLVGVFVLYAHGLLWAWLLPLAFLPLTTVLGVVGARNRARYEQRRTTPPVLVPPLTAPAPGLALPLVGLVAFAVSRVAAGLMTDGDRDVIALFFVGVVWAVLVRFHHWSGARRPWNLPPLLFALAASVSLGLGALFAVVPDQTNMAMMGALLGPMLTWFLVWVVRRNVLRRAQRAFSPHPGTGATMGS